MPTCGPLSGSLWRSNMKKFLLLGVLTAATILGGCTINDTPDSVIVDDKPDTVVVPDDKPDVVINPPATTGN